VTVTVTVNGTALMIAIVVATVNETETDVGLVLATDIVSRIATESATETVDPGTEMDHDPHDPIDIPVRALPLEPDHDRDLAAVIVDAAMNDEEVAGLSDEVGRRSRSASRDRIVLCLYLSCILT